METRLDRIEKAIEVMLLGISELKESQKKIVAQILELKESQKKTDEQMRRTDAKLDRIGRQLADMGLRSFDNPIPAFRLTRNAKH